MKKIMLYMVIAVFIFSITLKSNADNSQISYSEKFINNLTRCVPYSETIKMKAPYWSDKNGKREIKGYIDQQITFSIAGIKNGKCIFNTMQKLGPALPDGDEYKTLRVMSTMYITCPLDAQGREQMADKLKEYNKSSERTQVKADSDLCKVMVYYQNKWVDYSSLDMNTVK